MLAYRVDRCGDMQVGEVLKTRSLEFNIPELNRSFVKRFPDGVSSHGWNYLYTTPKIEESGLYFAELIYEDVRLTLFPELPSRYTSFFGFQTEQEAKSWSLKNGYDVYEVEYSKGIVLDMNLMAGVNVEKLSIPAVMNHAMKYWSGEKSEDYQPEVLMCSPIKILRKCKNLGLPDDFRFCGS